LKRSEISPLTNATRRALPKQAGTKYNKAGCADLKTCKMTTVKTSPRKYARKLE